ncbi:MAG: NUDIX domain-containing protein [Nanoarchaeota archaeon]|nr:NUDIX domain-containing protein [Nanoarchaeota archaeon]MBU1005315.1 NUDIX domain-containing protein [Nanoarchaeota archaeon]MBU1945513.1 NUDIX domain-containing protein [Nanoarchaeota archaeon]
MKPSQKERSAGAIIFSINGHRSYLLLHYPEGHWDFPKGHIEQDEEEKQAALREIKEETGISNIKFIEDFKEKIHYFYTGEKKLISKEVIFYLAEADSQEITISFEHIGFIWLPYKESLERLTYKNAKGLLERAEILLNSN